MKKGICNNPECDLCLSRELQEVEDGSEFVCRDCGQPLKMAVEKKKNANSGKKKLVIIILAAALLLIGIIVACILLFGKSEPLTLSLDKKSAELTVGENDTLTSVITPEGSEYALLWASDNESVAMVSSNGIVKAVGEGEANVTLVVKTKKEEVKAVCHYTIRPLPSDTADTVVPFTQLSFVRESIEMTIGDTVQLSLLKEPAMGNEAIAWKSSDEEIVSVDLYGLLIALKDGSVEVTATSTESQLVATMPVTVKKPVARKQGTASTSGKKDLGYATFEGPMQNGKPHGNGTLYFKQNHVIPGTVNVTAEAGEKVIGSFREGKVNVGTLYRKNGNQVVVRAGQEF